MSIPTVAGIVMSRIRLMPCTVVFYLFDILLCSGFGKQKGKELL